MTTPDLTQPQPPPPPSLTDLPVPTVAGLDKTHLAVIEKETELTSENYYESRKMSNSQRKAWKQCAAMAYAAYWAKTYVRPTTAAMAKGALADALVLDESDIERVILEHKDHLFTQKGQPNAAFKEAEATAEFLKAHPTYPTIQGCAKQEIYQFTLGGFECKARMDLVDHGRQIIWDMKTCRGLFAMDYSIPYKRYVSWIAAGEYDVQMAMYREAVLQATGNQYQVGILALAGTTTTRKVPDLMWILLDPAKGWDIDSRLGDAVDDMAYIREQLSQPAEDIHRCDERPPDDRPKDQDCDYCARTRTNWFRAPMGPGPKRHEQEMAM